MEFLEIIGRTLSVYVFILLAFILFGKREISQLSIIDLVFVLLVSNSVQNAMVGPSTTLLGGITSAGSLFAATYFFKLLIFKNKKINLLIEGEPAILVKNGIVMEKTMQKLQITFNELEAAVREHGIETVNSVKIACLETDGNISVVSYSDEDGKETSFKLDHHRKNKKYRHQV